MSVRSTPERNMMRRRIWLLLRATTSLERTESRNFLKKDKASKMNSYLKVYNIMFRWVSECRPNGLLNQLYKNLVCSHENNNFCVFLHFSTGSVSFKLQFFMLHTPTTAILILSLAHLVYSYYKLPLKFFWHCSHTMVLMQETDTTTSRYWIIAMS